MKIINKTWLHCSLLTIFSLKHFCLRDFSTGWPTGSFYQFRFLVGASFYICVIATGFSDDGASNTLNSSGVASNVETTVTDSFSTMDTLDDKYKLSVGDQLSFRILEDQQDPREMLDPKPPLAVTDSGDVEVPYIGRYPAAGKTCKQLAIQIKAALEHKYYYHATVILALDTVTKSNGRVYVDGQVGATGAIAIPGDEVLTLSKAILLAGGFTQYADKAHVKLTHRAEGNNAKYSTVVVNVSDILERGHTENDLKLEPGDMIYVPSRLISF